MDYKIWFHQTWPTALNRTLRFGLRKSSRILNKSDALSDCAQNKNLPGLWKFDSPAELFEDPTLHQALDRLMERMRLS